MPADHNRYKKRLEKIRKAIVAGKIEIEEAESLVNSLSIAFRAEDVLEWGKYYFPEKFPKNFCPLHDYLVGIRHETSTATLAPRDHAKTTIMCFLVPIFQALNEPERYRHYLNIQETATKAATTNLNIRRQLEYNEKLIADYGDQFNKEKWTDAQFILKNGVIFSCAGAGQSVRGLNVDNIRPDFVIIDDLYETSDIGSRDAIRKKSEWYFSDLIPALADDSLGQPVSRHIIGTAISRQDILHIQEEKAKRSEKILFKRFQAVIDWDKPETLWKPVDWLKEKKEDIGSITFNREYQNNVRNDEDSIIKEYQIQRFDGEIPSDQKVVDRICFIDPAEKLKEINDYTAGVACFITDAGNFYIMDAKNHKLSFNQNKLEIIAWHERLNFTCVPFETNKAYGLFEELRRTTNLPMREVIAKKDKITRLIGVSSKFENMKVFFSTKINRLILDEMIEQLITPFPHHDDLRDAVVGALEFQRREFYMG